MIQFREASLADRADFTGMNDFDLGTPPLIADLKIDGEPATATVARDDNDRFRIEIIHEKFTAALTGNRAAFAFVQLTEAMTACQLADLGFDIHVLD